MTAPFAQAETLRRWREHPAQFVRELFNVVPDAWQDEMLEAFPSSPRLAVKAAKGPGKTACLAWLGWNFLLTRSHPMIGATSITGDNLDANLWTELARWRAKSELLQQAFEQTGSEVFFKGHRMTWRLEKRTWPKDADETQIGNALAGLHAKYVMWLADESGAYPEAILPTLEGIFAGEPVEAHIVQAGNPIMLSGPLYRACTLARTLWRVIEITGDPDSPRRSPRISVEHAREQIRQYGRDNPWVKVNIFGEFPASNISALLGPNDMLAAKQRKYRPEEFANLAMILGVDVAREGDDASVIFPRRGLVAYAPTVMRNVLSIEGAGRVAYIQDDMQADATFIDATGGFGSAWIDQLVALSRECIGVHFSQKPANGRYVNKRAEMALVAAEWIKNGGSIPDIPELDAAFTQTTYSFQGDKLLIEPKADVKARLGYSPDHFDGFILTFAHPAEKKYRGPFAGQPRGHQSDYDPFSRDRVLPQGGPESYVYDPIR